MDLKEEDPLFRPPDFEEEQRRKAKKNNKLQWFKKNKNIQSVMFVDATPNSELLNMLKATEELYKIDEDKRVKFVEKPGMKIINRVSLTDPFRKNCIEEDCLSCKGSNFYTNCRRFNIGYSLVCKLCEERGIHRVYQGESSRSLYL